MTERCFLPIICPEKVHQIERFYYLLSNFILFLSYQIISKSQLSILCDIPKIYQWKSHALKDLPREKKAINVCFYTILDHSNQNTWPTSLSKLKNGLKTGQQFLKPTSFPASFNIGLSWKKDVLYRYTFESIWYMRVFMVVAAAMQSNLEN